VSTHSWAFLFHAAECLDFPSSTAPEIVGLYDTTCNYKRDNIVGELVYLRSPAMVVQVACYRNAPATGHRRSLTQGIAEDATAAAGLSALCRKT